MHEVKDTIEATAAAVGSKATGAGSAVTLVGWFTSSEFGMWAGILIGVGGLAVNWYFKRKADKRFQEAHSAYMQTLKNSAPHEGEF